MDKYTQLQLVEEGFWDSFGRVARMGIQAGKEIAKVVTPQSYQNAKNAVDAIRGARGRIKTEGMTKQERILDWLDEMGFTPIENAELKKIRNFGGGKTHWAIDVGVKGVDKQGNTIIIRNFKEPTAIIQYDDLKDGKSDTATMKFVLRPDRRRMYYNDDVYDDDGADNQQQTGNTSTATQQAGNQQTTTQQTGNAPAATQQATTPPSATTQQASNSSAAKKQPAKKQPARKQPARKQPVKKRTSRTR